MAREIIFSYDCSIEYDDTKVVRNGKEIAVDQDKYSSTEECAIHQMRQTYREVLSRQYENIVVLTGAGSSVGVGVDGKTGKTMFELWKAVEQQLGKEKLERFAETIHFSLADSDNNDLEALLSRASLSEAYKHNNRIASTIDKIKEIIKENCTLSLPDNSPHSVFLRKLTARKLKYSRVKLFTLNYDLLFEQAASLGGYVIIDGFSFNTPRLFNGTNFDYDVVTRSAHRSITEENFYPKVFHLYKIHGSLDWEKQKDGTFAKKNNPQSSVMIYPSSHKYESSYEQPYFEMISRFQQELRNKNSLFIVIGFSFYDKHIKAMIDEAINLNPGITMIVVSPDVDNPEKYIDLKTKCKSMRNIMLVNERFADFVEYFPYSDIYDYSEDGEENNDTI